MSLLPPRPPRARHPGQGHWTPHYVRWTIRDPPGMTHKGGEMCGIPRLSQPPQRTACAPRRPALRYLSPARDATHPPPSRGIPGGSQLPQRAQQEECDPAQEARPQRNVRRRRRTTRETWGRGRRSQKQRRRFGQQHCQKPVSRGSVEHGNSLLRVFCPVLGFVRSFFELDTAARPPGRPAGREIFSDAKARQL